MSGEKRIVDGTKIRVELSRSPRVRFNVAPDYFTSFANIADILEQAQSVKEIAVDRELLKKGVHVAEWVEKNPKMRCIAWPATFSHLQSRSSFLRHAERSEASREGSGSGSFTNALVPPQWDLRDDTLRVGRYKDEIVVPPIAPPPQPNNDSIEKGIFVTITGIPGLERLYADAKRLGLKLYSNDTEAVPSSAHALPHIIPNKHIMFQFARSGWSSVWISMISGTPLVVPDFDAHDDPEIYFNNRAVEELGLGIIYRGQPLEEILAQAETIKQSSAAIKQQVLDKWGTLDGNRYCAKMFVEDFLRH